jgi:hypothetical protein
MRIIVLLSILALAAVLNGAAGSHAVGGPLNRPQDPVVLTGAVVPSLADVDPDDVVAFKYDGGWQQIPVQVDEKDQVEFARVYGAYDTATNPTGSAQGATGLFAEQYTDTGTFTGADSDPTLDADDEIVFMARNAGEIAGTAVEPPGVVAASGVWLTIIDPLAPGKTGHVYLFESDGSLTPDAGQQYVTYAFNLLSGDYKTNYLLQGGPGTSHGPQANAEDSLLSTPYYERHWSYRWTNDDLRILLGTGVDILEKSDYWIVEGNCGRHNGTFNAKEGAFFANKSGPVRAIRSYMGANSGPLTQVEQIFYEQREDSVVYARVHSRPALGIGYNDYDANAIGMTYSNTNNTGGLTIDGVNDPGYVAGPMSWEMITGAQGSVVTTFDVETDIPNFEDGSSSYYHDEVNAPVTMCQACEEAPTAACPSVVTISDADLIGAHGAAGTTPIPNTDPRMAQPFSLTVSSTHYYEAPGLTVPEAEALVEQAAAPLQVTTAGFPVGDTDGDGCSDLQENGFDETLGGLRDYLNPYDYYDVNGDQTIDLPNDILGVVFHYAPSGNERPHPWSMTAPDGVIDLSNDILGVVQQYNHDCS